MEIGNPPVAYIDGGMGYNNPIRAFIEETSNIWPSDRISCIVSIGTRVLISRDVGRTIIPLFDKFTEIATDIEKLAREFEEEMKYRYGIEQKVHFRFNVQYSLKQVGLEEWREMDRTKELLEQGRSMLIRDLRPEKYVRRLVLEPYTRRWFP